MKNVHRIVVTLALVFVVAAATGCTFGVSPLEARGPALAAVPPCFSGDICAVPVDSVGLAWLRDGVHSARR